VEYRVLGPVEVRVDGRPVAVGGPKPRSLLALLLLNANRVVPTAQLIEALWGGTPPMSGATRVQGLVSELRASFARAGVADGPVATHPHGYLLTVGDGELDLDAFERRRVEGGAAAARGDLPAAAAACRAALDLWRGPALTGVAAPFADAERTRLEERRLAAEEELAEAELALGEHARLVGELTVLVERHPLRERPRELLMLALYRSGRQAEALELYREGRRQLVDQQGLEPGPDLQRLQRAILAGDPGLLLDAGASRPSGPAAAGAGSAVTPAQLPADAAGFVGRAGDLRQLDALLPDPDDASGTAMPIATVAGMAGVGKTALAVHWAHQVAGRFPGGQLYLDLRGYSETTPVRPIEGLRQLLHGLGVDQVPADLEEAASLYRSLTAGRRLLVLLDNAATADQVRPLLPGNPGCLVVVTSRDRLAGLVASHGARRLVLGPLHPEEAQALVTEVVGGERVEGEAEAAADLARACAHLPLALRIAAANLADDPHQPIASQVAALRAGDRLAALEVEGDPGAAVRSAFDASYRRLAPPERRLFRLLGLVPGPHVSVPSAAALVADDPDQARRTLGRLAAAHLVDEYVPGRYRLHDLLRLYAAECAREVDAGERAEATGRLLEQYLDTAGEAARLLYPEKLRLPRPGPGDRAGPPPFSDRAQALDWLDAEAPNLVAAARDAAGHGAPRLAWLLADTLRGYFWLRVPALSWLEVASAGLAAAVAGDDARAQGAAQLSLGDLHLHRNRYPAAIEHYGEAVRHSRAAGWPEGEVIALGDLGLAHWRLGRLPVAVDHLTRSLTLARRTGWRMGERAALHHLGIVHAEAGLLDEAHQRLTAALALTEDPAPMRAAMLDGLGEVCWARGQLQEALGHLTRALAIFQAVGSRGGQADTLRNLVAVHCDAGRHDQAVELAGEALELAGQIGNRVLQAGVLNALGRTWRHAGDHRAALQRHRQALEVARQVRARGQEGEALAGLAAARRHLGEPEAAREDAVQALRLARDAGHRLGEARALRVLGDAVRDTEGTDAALPHWRAALAIFAGAGATPEAGAVRDLLEAAGEPLGLDR
jgi:DNA-binding SARP family transcriptional activator